ncbi:hypothetical protein [Kiritimatiella glycovorans]|uniref:Uncharacterized protein n=1 Tax=Kiritimatiella glycovorans TaxID=1307763 RepID=A0A0G3EDD2_9BACT|nr:hypothetical protein [Kiritimatiella glycovorans]AKJ64476.1 hypothetical protein L21SP4_01228 [Kiritimatiella glycovorans]
MTDCHANALFFDGPVEALHYTDPRIQSLEGRRQLFIGDPNSDWAPGLR